MSTEPDYRKRNNIKEKDISFLSNKKSLKAIALRDFFSENFMTLPLRAESEVNRIVK